MAPLLLSRFAHHLPSPCDVASFVSASCRLEDDSREVHQRFLHACQEGDITGTNVGADLNKLDWTGWSGLHYAARCGHSALVKELVGMGTSPDLQGKKGQTPLQVAIAYRKPQVVEALMESGADPNLATSDPSPAQLLPCTDRLYALARSSWRVGSYEVDLVACLPDEPGAPDPWFASRTIAV